MVKVTYKRQWNTNFVREKRKRLSDSEREALNSQRREKYAERLKEKRQAKALLKLTSKRPADYMREKRMKAKVAREVEIANLAAVLETNRAGNLYKLTDGFTESVKICCGTVAVTAKKRLKQV